MWNPRMESLRDPETWLAAAGQIFFSLSVGFGIVVNYASYLKKDDDVVLSGLTASSMNEFFEVCLGGLITMTAAFIFLGSGGGLVWHVWSGIQCAAQRVCRDARRPHFRFRLVHDACSWRRLRAAFRCCSR